MGFELVVTDRIKGVSCARRRFVSFDDVQDFLLDSKNELPELISVDECVPQGVFVWFKLRLARNERTKDVEMRLIDPESLQPGAATFQTSNQV